MEFYIQFFIVVLGVFVTPWAGNLAERNKQKRETRQTLQIYAAFTDGLFSLTLIESLMEQNIPYIEATVTDIDLYLGKVPRGTHIERLAQLY